MTSLSLLRLTLLLLTTLLAVPAAAVEFRYDASRGTCLNSGGERGLNQVSPASLFVPDSPGGKVFSGKDAECADLRAFDFEPWVSLDYAELVGWNLRGADLSGARFFFAKLLQADLAGANLGALNFGYAEITGRVDSATVVPAGPSCQVEAASVRCRQ